MNPLPSKPDPRDVESVLAENRPRLNGIANGIRLTIHREGIDLSERKDTGNVGR
jgi:hypothetical protein